MRVGILTALAACGCSFDGASVGPTEGNEDGGPAIDGAADPDAPTASADASPEAMIVHRVNVGGPAVSGADAENLGPWSADDQGACSGTLPSAGPTGPVNDTEDDDLYRFFRFGTVMCSLAVTNGDYRVRFLLAEVYRAGCVTGETVRDMAIEIEGTTVDTFDLIAETGGCAGDPGQAASPFERVYMVTVADGVLDAGGVPNGDNALVGAIEVALMP